MYRAVKIILCFFAAMAVLLPLKSPVYADRAYSISGYKIKAAVTADGSAIIEERLTYSFSGDFNGMQRDVDFSETKGLVEQQVFVESANGIMEYELNESNSLDDSGQPGTYNLAIEDDKAHFKVFEPSSNEEKTFIIKYRLLDAVTKYNDVAVFNRRLIDTGWQTQLNNVDIRVVLPEGAAAEDIKVFAHGPLTGRSSIIDGQNVEFTVPGVSPGTFVETLVIFPTRLVPEAANTVDKDGLPEIMENEGRLAEEANRTREEARKQVEAQRQREIQQALELDRRINALRPYGIAATVLLILFWFYLIIHIYLKYDKELKHNFQGKYYRELPGEYTPAEMSVLLSFGYVQPRDIMATLMDLVRKKQLELVTNKTVKRGIFKEKEIVEYVISLRQDAPQVKLKKHEDHLIQWFIGEIGNGISVNLDEIKDYASSGKHSTQFKSDYDQWCLLAKEEAQRNDFFDETSKTGRWIGVLSGIAYLGAGIVIAILLYTGAACVLSLLGLILVIFSVRIKRCTAYGNEQRAMWNAFRNFLKDFSNMEKAIIPSIVLWEHYLVYAISLGVAKEVIKQLPLVFSDDDLNDVRLTYMHGAAYGYFAGFHTMFDNTIHTVENAISSAVTIANSADSSSSGSGGGFSGGTSGGGGGGGGGGAF